MYEMQIVARARQLAPGARVMWPRQDAANNWGAAMYLPLTGQVALFHRFPISIVGRTGPGNGLTSYNYGGLASSPDDFIACRRTGG
jgi:hypothetical protein